MDREADGEFGLGRKISEETLQGRKKAEKAFCKVLCFVANNSYSRRGERKKTASGPASDREEFVRFLIHIVYVTQHHHFPFKVTFISLCALPLLLYCV